MVGGKEAGTESRFKQWTSMMEGLPSVATQEANMHKNGKSEQSFMSWKCSALSRPCNISLQIILKLKSLAFCHMDG